MNSVANKSSLEFSFKGYVGTDHVKTRGKEPECGSKGPENKALGLREDLSEVWGMVREGDMGLAMEDGRAL